MKLLNVVFLLFLNFVTESLSFENVNKTRDVLPGLAKHPKGFLRRRQFSIPKLLKDEETIRFWNRNKKVLNSSKSISKSGAGYRRPKQIFHKRHRRKYSDETSKSSSTDMEMLEWKKEFDADWLILKQQAIRQMNKSKYWHGDEVGLIAARPLAHPCGDAQQHDLPWGTCMLPQQCEPEYRIYRGDLFCGRSSLICCSVMLTHHDLYQGLDMSFVRTSSSDSDEKSKRELDSHEIRLKKMRHNKIRAYKKVLRQKILIKRKIKQLIHKIKKNVGRAYRNNSADQKRLRQNLAVKVEELKDQFREQRKMAHFRYDLDLDEIKRKVYNQLVYLNLINAHLFYNESFKEFLEKHNIGLVELRSLQLQYPNLARYVAGDGTISEGLQQILDLAMGNGIQAELVKASEKTTKVFTSNIAKAKPKQIAVAALRQRKKFKQPAFNSHRAVPQKIKAHQLTAVTFEETVPTQRPINLLNKYKKKGLRTLDISADDVSASLVYTPLSKSKPQIKDRNKTAPEAVYSEEETNVTPLNKTAPEAVNSEEETQVTPLNKTAPEAVYSEEETHVTPLNKTAPEAVNSAEETQVTPLNKTAPEAVYSEEETHVTIKLPRIEGFTVLNASPPTMLNYVAMESEIMQDTRRSGQGPERHDKEEKRHLDYDIEFGLDYFL